MLLKPRNLTEIFFGFALLQLRRFIAPIEPLRKPKKNEHPTKRLASRSPEAHKASVTRV